MNDAEKLAELKKRRNRAVYPQASLTIVEIDWLIGLVERGLQMEATLAKVEEPCIEFRVLNGKTQFGCQFCEAFPDPQHIDDHKPDCLWRQAVERQKRGGMK